jgi:hypothetical protein
MNQSKTFIQRNMIRKSFILLLALLAATASYSQKVKIKEKDLKLYVRILASDSLKGRKPGTPEMDIAAEVVNSVFGSAGLKPLAENGFQYFSIVTDVTLGDGNKLSLPGYDANFKKEFIPLAFSTSGEVKAGVVFAGYGFDLDIDSLKWSDYAGIDVKGKWVLIFRADPELERTDSRFIPFSDSRSKVLAAKDKGAAGVLFITPKGLDKDDKLIPLIVENNEMTSGIPVLSIKREIADRILSSKGFTADSLENLIVSSKRPRSFETGVEITGKVEISQKHARTANVIGLLEGSDKVLKDEYLVVGGHYDHLGFGGPNSGSRVPDTVAIHNGADDNASGTAMVMELAKGLSAQKKKLKRSIIFVAFSGEEMGLLGSKYFVNNCPVDIRKIKAMFNFDMIGRYDPSRKSISVGGTGTSAEGDSILKIYEKGLPFGVIHSPDGYGPSDHAAFYSSNIPVFFFTTGVHMDYHTPKDDADLLDYKAETKIGEFAAALIMNVDNLDKDLTFRESGRKENTGRSGRRLKVTLGIMPDFAGSEKKGLRVDGVTKDGPAYKGGMQKGDIIVSVQGMKVENIYDYMARLNKLKQGMTVNVEVIRNGRTEILIIQL